jgi:hypothetical protein
MSVYVQTHTLPLALMVVLVLLGAAALGRLYRRKRQLQGAVEQQFQVFREKAVALMDQLDALRQRHRTLPSTDPDFTAPMSGATLAFYHSVEADLNVLWERWLRLMELWDQAQNLIRSSSGLAVRQAEEARKLPDQGHADELLHHSARCKEHLDRLNGAHELARASLEAGRKELDELRRSIEEGTRGLSPSDSRGDEIARLETLLDQAEGMIVADPIGAEEVIVRTRRSLTGLLHGPAQRPDRLTVRNPSESPFHDLTAAADAFRAVAARLRFTNLLGLLVRFWLVVWGIALVFGLLGALMPLILLFSGLVLVVAGFWVIWQMVTFWFWYGMWQMRR